MAERAEKKKAAETAEEVALAQGPETGAAASVALSISDIKELFVLMKTNEIAELNLEQQGTKIHIVSTHAPQPAVSGAGMQAMMPMMHPGMVNMQAAPAPALDAGGRSPSPASGEAGGATTEAPAPSNLKTITSPMVGTFYRSPAPDAPSFVRPGDSVTEETVLCIIEAMKLMNEIKAECKGRIHKTLVENGVPVEYNQPLFLIEVE